MHAAYVHCGYNHYAICAYVTGSRKRDNYTQFQNRVIGTHQPGPAEWPLMNVVSISHGMHTNGFQ